MGWGHSAIGHVVAFAQKADVEHLVLFHHDPGHTDVEMEALVAEARRIWGTGAEQLTSAWDGMTIHLDANGIRLAGVPGSVPGGP